MLGILLMCSGLLSTNALAQEHYTEAPVWEVSYYRTKQGHFDDYMKYLRANYLPQTMERKKQGLILDYKVYINSNINSPGDWDVAIATLYPNWAALDFNKSDDDKNDAITAKHYRTQSKEKQQQMAAERFKFRDHLSTHRVREVTLKPMP